MHRPLLFALIFTLAWSLTPLNAQPDGASGTMDESSRQPTVSEPSYQNRELAGWPILVSEQLLKEQPEATRIALDLAAAQLKTIQQRLPGDIVKQLQRVPIWFSPAYPGVRPTAEYHPNQRWLIRNGRTAKLQKCVQLTNIPIFERECKRMPMLMLHELAHAYHDQVLGFQHPEVVATFEAADEAGLYEQVKRSNGRVERAYAATNHKEYFAELSEAYFGTNDFFPFNREELREHDPRAYRLLEKIWRIDTASAE